MAARAPRVDLLYYTMIKEQREPGNELNGPGLGRELETRSEERNDEMVDDADGDDKVKQNPEQLPQPFLERLPGGVGVGFGVDHGHWMFV